MRLIEALQLLLFAGTAAVMPRPAPTRPALVHLPEPEPIPILDEPGTPEAEARELREWLDAEGLRLTRWHGNGGIYDHYLFYCDCVRRLPCPRVPLREAWGALEDGPVRIHAPDAAARLPCGQPEGQQGQAPEGATQTWDRDRTLAWVQSQIAAGDHPTQETIRTVSGRAKQTVSDWCAYWERHGLIPARRWAGKTKIIEPATVGLRKAA
jgi:hypothetical protein